MNKAASVWRQGPPPRRGAWLTRTPHGAPARWRYWFGPVLGWGRAWAKRTDALAHGAGLRGFEPRYDTRRRAAEGLLWASERAVHEDEAQKRAMLRASQLRKIHAELRDLTARIERELAPGKN